MKWPPRLFASRNALDVPLPEATALRPVQACTSRLGAAGLSPEGAKRFSGGFTLLELLLVIAIVATASVGVTLAMRDSGQAQLETEAQALAAVLESARAQSRASGLPVRWRATATGFAINDKPQAWTSGGIAASSGQPLLLGPEPIIAPQSVRLWLTAQPSKSVRVSTDGVRPFAVQNVAP